MKSSTSLIDCFWDAAVKVSTESQMEMWRPLGSPRKVCVPLRPHGFSLSFHAFILWTCALVLSSWPFCEGAPQAEEALSTPRDPKGCWVNNFPRVAVHLERLLRASRREGLQVTGRGAARWWFYRVRETQHCRCRRGTVQGNSLESSLTILHPLFLGRHLLTL